MDRLFARALLMAALGVSAVPAQSPGDEGPDSMNARREWLFNQRAYPLGFIPGGVRARAGDGTQPPTGAARRRPLPLGSSLRNGVFYWQPPAGFLGDYQLEFVRPDGGVIRAQITIQSK